MHKTNVFFLIASIVIHLMLLMVISHYWPEHQTSLGASPSRALYARACLQMVLDRKNKRNCRKLCTSTGGSEIAACRCLGPKPYRMCVKTKRCQWWLAMERLATIGYPVQPSCHFWPFWLRAVRLHILRARTPFLALSYLPHLLCAIYKRSKHDVREPLAKFLVICAKNIALRGTRNR